MMTMVVAVLAAVAILLVTVAPSADLEPASHWGSSKGS